MRFVPAVFTLAWEIGNFNGPYILFEQNKLINIVLLISFAFCDVPGRVHLIISLILWPDPAAPDVK